MKQPAADGGRTIYFKVEAAQYRLLKDKVSKTTCRSLAEYLRKLVLSEPVTINYRDASMEDLISELSQTRRQLAQAVRALELSAHAPAHTTAQQQLAIWKDHQGQRGYITGLIEQIHEHCKKMAHLWLQ
ncbi:hypothetical protein [Dyadobacter sp. MSC1_007]|jgi:hypothetical protein|uniref:hypothetical protein n=1 Tax=Dyadobacter sp. MSC1_007 TaxID=2909264 RepID=UPI0020303FBD|nr:hypothetical protein [Dyadobacter sp. MSC1_007]